MVVMPTASILTTVTHQTRLVQWTWNYYQFEFILEQAMSVTHVAVILCMRTGPAYEEESMKMDYPDVRNEYSML